MIIGEDRVKIIIHVVLGVVTWRYPVIFPGFVLYQLLKEDNNRMPSITDYAAGLIVGFLI